MVNIFKNRQITKLKNFDYSYKAKTGKSQIVFDEKDFEAVIDYDEDTVYNVTKVLLPASNAPAKYHPFVFYFDKKGNINFRLLNTNKDNNCSDLHNGDNFKVKLLSESIQAEANKSVSCKYNCIDKIVKQRLPFETAKFFSGVLDQEKGKQHSPQTNYLLRSLYDNAREIVFYEYVKIINEFEKYLETDSIFNKLKELKKDVNSMPLKNFVNKYEIYTQNMYEVGWFLKQKEIAKRRILEEKLEAGKKKENKVSEKKDDMVL